MSQNTGNSRAFIEAEQYSSLILQNLHDGLLPGSFYRNVTDFPSGTTLNIKTVGSVTIQDGAEDVPFEYSPIESGTIQMTIDNYTGDAWYVTDELREDGAQIDQLLNARAMESTRAIQETFETRFLKRANTAQIDANPNKINGFAHRIASTASGNVMSISDIVAMKLAFDKANVSTAGRVAIVDPVTAATLSKLVGITHDVTGFGEKILENGFARDHDYIMKLHGFHIITSNRLDRGTFSDGTTSVTDGVANLFMSVANDTDKPLMTAWRRMPKAESERNKDLRRDEFVTSCRWGTGVQRVDTLGVYITSASNY
jgi:hypothetical protein